jgi:glucosyl-dolichyl phosphate glucuronosyltransferase
MVIPTYRRSALLLDLLRSIEHMDKVETVEFGVIVVDNNSGDDTRSVVESFAETAKTRVDYLLETVPGKSSAVNAAFRQSDADVVAIIDDDERVWPDWLSEAAKAWTLLSPDFLGGAVVPDLDDKSRPAWIPPDWPAVIGDIRAQKEVVAFADQPGRTLMGGNMLIRRELFLKLGGYHPDLGRIGDKRLLSCEDHDLTDRLHDAGAHGFYIPSMTVWHHVPQNRLTRAYYRRFAFDHGYSLAKYQGIRKRRPKRAFLGVELWKWKEICLGLPYALASLAHPEPGSKLLGHELEWRQTFGRVWGRFL